MTLISQMGLYFSNCALCETEKKILIFSDSQLMPRNTVGGTIKVHGRTHITGIEVSQFGLSKDTNQIFGSSDEICATCIIVLDNDESVERIRYRTGMPGPCSMDHFMD